MTFEVLSLVKGAVAQGAAYSIAASNFRSLTGDTCGLANDVLVETDPNASMLTPITGSVADGLDDGNTANTGFTPNGVARDLTADEEERSIGGANTVDADASRTSDITGAGTGGGTEEQAGINGSQVRCRSAWTRRARRCSAATPMASRSRRR